MPLVIKNENLLKRIGDIDTNAALSEKEATGHSIRELHIGIVNMMPAGALKTTELQFLLPIGKAAGFLKIIPHFIKVDGIDYGSQQKYVDEDYITFDQAKENGLDAMIVTGANIPNSELEDGVSSNPFPDDLAFYNSLKEIIEYAESDEGPTSTLYSCLAFHAYMQSKHGEIRQKLDNKQWGNFDHWTTNIEHPLIKNTSTKFNQPHSRMNEITWNQIFDSNMKLLAYSDEAGVLLATSSDGLRAVCMQGHPEYDGTTLFREWRRDLSNTAFERAKDGNKIPLAPLPENYFIGNGLKLAKEFSDKVEAGEFNKQILLDGRLTVPNHISKNIIAQTPNTHSSTSNDIFANWITTVFSVTDRVLGKPFMPEIDPDNIFNLPEDQPICSPVYFEEYDQ